MRRDPLSWPRISAMKLRPLNIGNPMVTRGGAWIVGDIESVGIVIRKIELRQARPTGCVLLGFRDRNCHLHRSFIGAVETRQQIEAKTLHIGAELRGAPFAN